MAPIVKILLIGTESYSEGDSEFLILIFEQIITICKDEDSLKKKTLIAVDRELHLSSFLFLVCCVFLVEELHLMVLVSVLISPRMFIESSFINSALTGRPISLIDCASHRKLLTT